MKKMLTRSLTLLVAVFLAASACVVSARADGAKDTGGTLPDGGVAAAMAEVSYTDISATAEWFLDGENEHDVGEHPIVYLKLYWAHVATEEEPVPVEGAELKAVETPQGEWTTTVTWTQMPDIDEDGRAFLYSVKEVDENGNDYSPNGYRKSEAGMEVYNVKQILPNADAVQSDSATAAVQSGSAADENQTLPATSAQSQDENTLPVTSAESEDDDNVWVWLILVAIAAAWGAITLVRKRRPRNK